MKNSAKMTYYVTNRTYPGDHRCGRSWDPAGSRQPATRRTLCRTCSSVSCSVSSCRAAWARLPGGWAALRALPSPVAPTKNPFVRRVQNPCGNHIQHTSSGDFSKTSTIPSPSADVHTLSSTTISISDLLLLLVLIPFLDYVTTETQ